VPQNNSSVLLLGKKKRATVSETLTETPGSIKSRYILLDDDDDDDDDDIVFHIEVYSSLALWSSRRGRSLATNDFCSIMPNNSGCRLHFSAS
jgi:hypothetical protein